MRLPFKNHPCFSKVLLLGGLCVAALGTTSRGATVATAAVGVYDDTTQGNAVDATVTPSVQSGSVNFVTLAQFKTDIINAYAADLGGVLNFEGIPDATFANSFTTSFGVTQGRTMVISTISGVDEFQIDMAARGAINATPISGGTTGTTGTYLRDQGDGIFNFNFSLPVTELGFTVLARNVSRNVTATLTYDNGSTAVVSPYSVAAVSNGQSASSTPDTFWGLAAPTGRTITSLQISAGTGNYFVIDDFAFIVPEPSRALLMWAGFGLLMARRRR